jgi:hypothetical protein
MINPDTNMKPVQVVNEQKKRTKRGIMIYLIETPKDPSWQIWPSSRWCCAWVIVKLFSMPQKEIYQHEYDKKWRK